MRRPSETDPRYQRDLEAGLEYEDFAVDVLLKTGLVLSSFKSKRSIRRGENRAGFEIKLDRKFSETGNLFIETEECSVAGLPMKPAGIYAPGNSWVYVIGNHSIMFMFAHTWLRRAHESGKFAVRSLPTSRGFLLPEEAAVYGAARVLDIDEHGTPTVRAYAPGDRFGVFSASQVPTPGRPRKEEHDASKSGLVVHQRLKNLPAWQATDADFAALGSLPFAGPRDRRDQSAWLARVRALCAESPLRDLPSCGIQARLELAAAAEAAE